MPPRRTQFRTLALFAALWAVLCSGLVPNGYMPGRTAYGGWGLVLCPDGGALGAGPAGAPDAASADGAHASHHAAEASQTQIAHQAAAVHGEHAHAGRAPPPDDPQPTHADTPRCAWAMAADPAGFAPEQAAFAQRWAYPSGAPGLARRDLTPGRGLAAPPPPSQGPPILNA